MTQPDLDQLCVNALRILAVEGVQKANSGHPGMPMGMADVAYTLWNRYLKANPSDPLWPNRDRFILSAGHGSMLLYSLLYLTGYPMTLEDLQHFRRFGSKTPGHPEYDPELGIETTTGPLGQGFANGVGMAIAAKHLAARFNKPGYPIFDHTIYAIVSDGEMMEGATHEAGSLAGHLGLDNLIYLYDDNEISIEGSTNLTFTEDVPARFRAYNWHVQEVDGHDLPAIARAIETAQDAAGRPHLIICHTHIAFGSPNLHDDAHAHGAPLGEEEIKLTKEALGWPYAESFFVPEQVLAQYRTLVVRGAEAQTAWDDMVARYTETFPEDSAELQRLLAGQLPANWADALPVFDPSDGPLATRAASGTVLNALAPVIPELIGGSADLEPSTKTFLKGYPAFQKDVPEGRNFHFGVRELGMGGLLNGMATYPGLRVYGATFMIFSDFMRPAVRLACLMKLPVTYVWTHDSIFVGEDGPTHEPVEQVMSLRLIPGMTVIRPADANETTAAWKVALLKKEGPLALSLTRQKLPIVTTPGAAADGVPRGGYVLSDSPLEAIDIILIATGSEVALALEAQTHLADDGIGARVISLPSWELFEAQPADYRESVLPKAIRVRLSVEAGVTIGWQRYVGLDGASIGVDRFGASAPYKVLAEAYGLTTANVVAKAKELLST
ncbi:MAG: transketolase [Anaerolineae bacterium]|nr:transketolase [Anaerolineae bacterium]